MLLRKHISDFLFGFAWLLMATAAAESQTLTTLAPFSGANGATPENTPLVQGLDGAFYGATIYGGTSKYGTIFRVTSQGVLTTLHIFSMTDGAYPVGLIRGTDGNFYGTAESGGAQDLGTVFKMTPAGVLTTLYSFDGSTGSTPQAGVIEASDGNFYGTATSGGPTTEGTVFKMTPAGSFTLLYAFSDPHGAGPNSPLIQATDGSLYGTTPNGGIYGMGSIFRITTTGVFTLLYSFNSPDGAYPAAGLLQATNGMLYGTTEFGGGSTGSGTIFQSDLTGALTTLYSFSGADGANSVASLVQATDGNLYGTTAGGGSYGTIFKITLSGVFTQLVSFDGTDGANPECALLQGSDRNLYGTTKGGGSSGLGTVFQLNVGLMKTGTVQVTTNSPQATFTLFGPTTYTGSGTSATFSDVPIGSYTILFGAASDLTAPWPQTEKLITNKTIAFAGTYSPLAPPCSSPYVCGCVMDDTYKNVPSYYNGTNPILSCNGPGAFGEQYQCVEYVKRFYAEAKAIDTLGWHGNGSQYYSMAAAFGLVADPPTCTTYPQTPCPSSTLPVPDDIVSFCNFNHLTGVCETPGTQYPGHVAIVKSVTVHGTTATVTFVEENYSPSGRIDLTATVTQNADGAYTMAPRANNTLKAYGWLRLPPAATKSTH